MSRGMQTFVLWGALVGVTFGLIAISDSINYQTEALLSETCGGE